MAKSKTKRMLRGAKLERSQIEILMHWAQDDADGYSWCYGSVVRNMYTKGREVVLTKAVYRRKRDGSQVVKEPESVYRVIKHK
jgi:hypothetical protein